VIEAELASGEMQVLLPQWPAPLVPIQHVTPRERQHAAKVAAFAEHVARAL
jgi:DNA-binding transcriptional LysR family regulator